MMCSDNNHHSVETIYEKKMSPKSSQKISTPIPEERVSSSNAPGRLKFFKDGRCLLELTHKESQDGVETWESGNPKNIFWPPPEIVKTEGFISIPVNKDHQNENPEPILQNSRRRMKSQPQLFDLAKQPRENLKNIIFAFKATSQIKKVVKKTRQLGRKGRRPFVKIVVGSALLQFEDTNKFNKSRKIRQRFEIDRIKKSSRLENNIARLISRKKSNKLVSVQPWLCGPEKQLKCPISSKGAKKSTAPDNQMANVTKEKFLKAWIPMESPKILPITPTKAVVKKASATKFSSHNATSLVTLEKHRIRLEIGRHHTPLPQYVPLSSSPNSKKSLNFPRNGLDNCFKRSPETPSSKDGFVFKEHQPFPERSNTSPYPEFSIYQADPTHSNANLFHLKQQKRVITELDYPVAKRLGLMPDSKQRFDENTLESRGNFKPKSSPFSIDSLISSNQNRIVTPCRPQPTKLVVPITPYNHKNFNSTAIDARIANLAGIAASPVLCLNQIDYMMNPFLASYVSAHTGSTSSMPSSPWPTSDRDSVTSMASNHEELNPTLTPSPPCLDGRILQLQKETSSRINHHYQDEHLGSVADGPLNLSLRR